MLQTFPTKSIKFAGKFTKKRHVRTTNIDNELEAFGWWWDGGSKSDYYLLDLETGSYSQISFPSIFSAAANNGRATVKPKPGQVVVVGGTFCGKPGNVTYYIPSHGDDEIYTLTLAYLTGDCPFGILSDRMKDADLISGGEYMPV